MKPLAEDPAGDRGSPPPGAGRAAHRPVHGGRSAQPPWWRRRSEPPPRPAVRGSASRSETLPASVRRSSPARWHTPAYGESLVPVVFGDGPTFERLPGLRRLPPVEARAPLPADGPARVAVTELAAEDRARESRRVPAGRRSWPTSTAAEAALRGEVDALCTAPVSKEQITRAGVRFMGHTELLAEAFGREVMMLMDGPAGEGGAGDQSPGAPGRAAGAGEDAARGTAPAALRLAPAGARAAAAHRGLRPEPPRGRGWAARGRGGPDHRPGDRARTAPRRGLHRALAGGWALRADPTGCRRTWCSRCSTTRRWWWPRPSTSTAR